MKLADYLAKHQITQATLAAHLDVSQGRVWQWLNGEKVTPKYCPEIEVWSNREVTCEELNDTVNWKYVRDSAQSISESEVAANIATRDDANTLGGTVDEKPTKRKGGGSRKIKGAHAPA
jgi:DNA-binding transcriptional regulator YdaS (Cro superfamily)